MLCPLDPCDAELYERDAVFACAEDFDCVEDPATGDAAIGVCAPAAAKIGAPCGSFLLEDGGPSNFARCRDGLFCSPLICPRTQAVIELSGVRPIQDDEGNSPAGVCLERPSDGDTCSSADGCSPCADGLSCIREGGSPDSTEGICRRQCGDADGNPDPDLCACGDPTRCEPLDSTRIIDGSDPPTDFFCGTCIPVNGGRSCIDDAECCADAFGASCEDVLGSDGEPRRNCCLPTDSTGCGTGPFAGTRNDGCCPGTICEGETCIACVTDGPREGQPCCADSRPDEFSDGGCVPCSSGLCSDFALRAIGRTATDEFVIPEVDEAAIRYPMSGGRTLETGGRIDTVEHRLHPNHRLYFFGESELLGATTVTGRDAQYLYFRDGAIPARTITAALGPNEAGLDWTHARVYDSGSCSTTVPWTLLAKLLTPSIATGLAELIQDVGPLRGAVLEKVEVGPQLRQRFSDPSFPRGPQDADDRLDLRVEFRLPDHRLPCPDPAEVTIDAQIRVGLKQGLTDDPDDFLAGRVRCTALPPVPGGVEYFSCVLPQFTTDSVGRASYSSVFPDSAATVRFLGPDSSSMLDVGCSWDSGSVEYECELPTFIFPVDDFGNPDPTGVDFAGAVQDVAIERNGVFAAPTARDLDIEVVSANVRKEGFPCFLGDPGPISGLTLQQIIINGFVGDLADDLAEGDLGALANLFVGPALQLNGIDPTHPLLNQSCSRDVDCQGPGNGLLGGFRHECVGETATTPGLCTDFRLEPRQVHILPQGLEIVLAEGRNDPQDGIIRGAVSVGGGAGLGAGGLLTGSCLPERFPSEPVLTVDGDYRRRALASEGFTMSADNDDAYPGLSFQLTNADNVLLADIVPGSSGTMEICNPSDEEAQRTCACEAQGLPCGATYAVNVGGSRGIFCVSGQCCANNCGGPTCVNYQTDPANCGGCGNACAASQTCTAGVCR